MADLEKYLTDTGMRERIAEIDRALTPLGLALARAHRLDGPTDFLALEGAAWRYGASLADMIVERSLLAASLDRDFRRAAGREARERYRSAGERRRIDNTGPNPAGVQLAGGSYVRLRTPYFRPLRKGMTGRPRQKRGEDGSGCYPVLEKLGIRDGVTPFTRSRVAKQTVLCSSYAEAQEQLASDGLVLDIKAITRIAVSTGERGLALREQAIEAAIRDPIPTTSAVEGKRIRVSIDGGRARTRTTHTDRRKKKNGRRAFDLEWREPRIITIDVLDADGATDDEHRPIYEVVVDHADAVFHVVVGLLRLIGAARASEVVLVTDGADWIWNRLDALVRDAGIPPERVRKILDYFHASEHVMDALRPCRFFDDAQRKQAHKDMSSQLLELGGPETVLDRLRLLAKGRRAAKVNKEIRYLEGHLEHMRYAELRAAKVPIGSGVVESAVKRVLNQRFKAASMCWRPDHLEPLVSLRAILKAGRWDDFMHALLEDRYWLEPHAGAQAEAA